MYVALRELRFARGRFVLIGSVVALITLLVGFLSGLTGGLATQNISAVLAIPADRLVFSPPSDGSSAVTFADSAITSDQAQQWSDVVGVTDVEPIGISQTRAESGSIRAAVAIFGVEPGFTVTAPDHGGTVSLSTGAASALDAAVGQTVTIGGADFTVTRISGDGWYSHTPVVQMTLSDWQTLAATMGEPGAYATVLGIAGDPDWDAADSVTSTVSTSVIGSLTALSSFRSEIGSLLMMVAMLFAISGLVIGAFFTVWTMQRKSDIAVLKALGASTSSLVRDALGQALIVLVLGIGVGLGLTWGLGIVAGSALPFMMSPVTTLLPGLMMTILGLAGAAFALRSVTSADPLTALGSTR